MSLPLRFRSLTPPLLIGWLSLVGAMVDPLAPAMAQGYQRGDLNGDSQVTSLDLGILESYLQGRQSLSDRQISAADVNGDGQITDQDLSALRQTQQASVAAPNSQVTLDSAYSGRVVDRQTGQPLAGVEVAIPGAGVSVRTDAQGRFQLPENVPSDQILVARLENYLPYSQATQSGSQSLELQLDRWDRSTTLVLETDVVRLGDNQYSAQSAAASQFRLPSQGYQLIRTFELDRLPSSPPTLQIGTLIGLDTPEAVRTGQSQVPYADMSPFSVALNGQPVTTLALGGNNISVPLPLPLLRPGINTLTLETGKTLHSGSDRSSISIPILGGIIGVRVPASQRGGRLDYDDIQLTNITVDLPGQ